MGLRMSHVRIGRRRVEQWLIWAGGGWVEAERGGGAAWRRRSVEVAHCGRPLGAARRAYACSTVSASSQIIASDQ